MIMKRYENPIMNISLFDMENIATQGSAVQQTAVEQAMAQAAELTGATEDNIMIIKY